MRIRYLLAAVLIAASSSASALDAACEAVLKASEARMKQPAWHSVTDIGGGTRLEVIKANGKFYRQTGKKWSLFPIDIDAAERSLLTQLRSGEAKLTQCKILGSEVVDGVPVMVVSSRTELKGAPPGDAKLYIGKMDGLPYRQVGSTITVVYRYKGVVAPAF